MQFQIYFAHHGIEHHSMLEAILHSITTDWLPYMLVSTVMVILVSSLVYKKRQTAITVHDS